MKEPYRKLFKRGQFHLTEDEVKLLIKATCRKKYKQSFRDRVIIELLAYQGMRRFEVAKIKIKDIDFERKTIKILGKKNIFRVAFIYSKILMENLKIYITYVSGFNGYLFPAVSSLNKKGHITKTQINRIVAKAGRYAKLDNPTPGLKNINPHILRHSCARILKDRGLDLETVQSVLGHLKFSSTMDVYGTKSVIEIQRELESKVANLFN